MPLVEFFDAIHRFGTKCDGQFIGIEARKIFGSSNRRRFTGRIPEDDRMRASRRAPTRP